MDNLELINQGMEGGMGFAFLSCALSFSFHFLSNTNSSDSVLRAILEQLECIYGLGAVVEKNTLSISRFKRLCFHMANPMYLSHTVTAVLF